MRRRSGNRPLRKSGKFIGKPVVDVAMMSFIGSDHQHNITKRRIVRKFPVPLCDLGRGYVLGTTLVDLREIVGVADDRLLLKIANDPMCGLRADEIKSEEAAVE
jgi:hypothetical protein